MPFYVNIGYAFSIPASVSVDGSIVLCKMPMHQLERRRKKKPETVPKRVSKKPKAPKPPKDPHMASLLFDPQLYLAELDVNQGEKSLGLCANLASYPWFGVKGLPAFDSAAQKQSEWKNAVAVLKHVRAHWPRKAPTSEQDIRDGAESCIDLQLQLGCEAVILPSPLTHDQNTPYHDELAWIDAGLAYARQHSDVPVYASVALSDLCLRFHEPEENALLELVADAVSARGVDGVYFVVEQTSEPSDARQCASARVLASSLHLIHLLSRECGLQVVTNFFGAFGVVCSAVGASRWSSNWYKSLHRLRIADQGAGGYAYPSYWSTPIATDIHLDKDFDRLVSDGLLDRIADSTSASQGLLAAATQGKKVEAVPAWEHRRGNVPRCTEHYLLAAVALERRLRMLPETEHIQHVDSWLAQCANAASAVGASLGVAGSTRINHVPAWHEALQIYRRIHRV